jgi:hypothetical protein
MVCTITQNIQLGTENANPLSNENSIQGRRILREDSCQYISRFRTDDFILIRKDIRSDCKGKLLLVFHDH